MKVKLLEHTPNPERVIAAAARLCYSSVGVDDILGKMTPDKAKEVVEKHLKGGAPVSEYTITNAIS